MDIPSTHIYVHIPVRTTFNHQARFRDVITSPIAVVIVSYVVVAHLPQHDWYQAIVKKVNALF